MQVNLGTFLEQLTAELHARYKTEVETLNEMTSTDYPAPQIQAQTIATGLIDAARSIATCVVEAYEVAFDDDQ